MLKKNTYLASLSIVVIAIAVFLNLAVSQLPENVREIDLTDNKLYSVSDEAAAYLNGLDKDVEIIVLAEEDAVDSRITKFLSNYGTKSDHLKISYRDPIAYPSLLTEYEAENNSIVVRCTETGKKRTISLDEIIHHEFDYQTFGYSETTFDADGQLTSAVDYVTKDNTDVVCTTTSHGEAKLGATVTSALEKANLSVKSVSLLQEEKVPDECSLLISYAPTKDLADDELSKMNTYLDGGGQAMLVLGEKLNALPNYEKLMADYGLALADGYIADSERFFQQFQSNYALFPVMDQGSPVTAELGSDDLALVLNSRGFTEAADKPADITLTPFMTTSAKASAVSNQQSSEKGTYILGSVAEKSGGGALTVFGSSSLIDEQILTSFSNVANLKIFTNAVTRKMTDVSNISIPAKSLAVTRNTVQNAGLWSVLYIGIIPICLLVIGFMYWLQRRKL